MTRAIVNGLGQGLDGDKTTTGAVCISSLPDSTQNGRGVLRLGDKTTACPQCGEVGTIVESSLAIHWNGMATALHGSRIQCGCPAGSNRLIAVPGAPAPRMEMPPASRNTEASGYVPPSGKPVSPARPVAPPSGAPSPDEDNEPTEPGFYIVPKSIGRRSLEAELFGDFPSPEMMRKFNALNGSLGQDIVKAGQLVVLSDPRNYMCKQEEAHLMQAAEEVAEALKDLSPEDADFMIKYQGQISSFLADTSLWAGVSAAVMERYFKDLEENMEAFQKLHQDSYRRDGHLGSKRFIEERRQLVTELDARLLNSRWLRSKTTLGDHPKLKKALRVSTKSLVHQWNKAGGTGPIPGYAKHIQAMSNATRYMKTGGYIAIAIGGAASVPVIYETCTTGSDEECQKVWMVEGGKFVGATAGGVGAGYVGGVTGKAVCALLGIHKAGKALCGVVGVGVGAAVGTTQGENAGELMGELIYDHFLYD